MSTITTREGVDIRFAVDGEQGSAVLLLHGMGSSYQTGWVERGWREALLGAGFTVIGMDSRGTGSSTPLENTDAFRNGAFLSDIAAVLDAAGASRAHIIGYSMGAGHALRYGLTNPGRVKSLTLGGLGGIALAMAGIYHRSGANTRRSLQTGQALVEALLRERSDALGRYAAAYFEALQQDALEAGALESLALPVLLCVGGGDTRQGDFAAFEVTQTLRERIPDARRVVFAGRDHATLVPDQEFQETVIDFLTQNDH